jgi:phage tail sheath protein FI
MGNYLSPDIYTKETDFSFYVKQISTSTAAMVGIAERGPINQATLVTSWEQFSRKFGGYIEKGYLAYAVRSFFDNGGAVLYVTRIAHNTDPTDKATLTAMRAVAAIPDRQPTPGVSLTISAIDHGSWGEKLSVSVEDGTRNPANEFNLVVRYKSDIVEVFKDLSMAEGEANHVEKMINGKSEFITVTDMSITSGSAMDRPALGSYSLSGGNDGLTGLVDADYIGDPSQHSGLFSFSEIDSLNLLMVPGVTTAPVINAGIAIAEKRKDLLFIADTPLMLEPSEVVDFRKGQGSYTHAAFNSSYAALYYPWLEISDPLTSNSKFIPPSGAVAGCIARSDQKSAVWYAPAGVDRGRIFNVLSIAYRTSREERDVLYPEGINCIAVFPDTGVNIWGQRTLLSQGSSVDRINVRRLMMFIEKAISQSSRFVVFEPNHERTWRALGRVVVPFLQDIKENGGMYDYAFQCDEETNTAAVIDRNEMIARVFVKPTKTAEFIELNFILTSTGTDFKEVR